MVERNNLIIMNAPTALPASRRTSAGFTIVELLVVIAIVIALTALIFVGVRKGIAAAHRADCNNNLRNLGAAIGGFIVDEGRYPNAGGVDGEPVWDRAIIPQISGGRAYVSGGQEPFQVGTEEASQIEPIAGYFQCKADTKKRESSYLKRSYALCPWTWHALIPGLCAGTGFRCRCSFLK